MANVNPPLFPPIPKSLQSDLEAVEYFNQLQFILFQLWERTGGGTDLIDESSILNTQPVVRNPKPKEELSVPTSGNAKVSQLESRLKYIELLLSSLPKSKREPDIVDANFKTRSRYTRLTVDNLVNSTLKDVSIVADNTNYTLEFYETDGGNVVNEFTFDETNNEWQMRINGSTANYMNLNDDGCELFGTSNRFKADEFHVSDNGTLRVSLVGSTSNEMEMRIGGSTSNKILFNSSGISLNGTIARYSGEQFHAAWSGTLRVSFVATSTSNTAELRIGGSSTNKAIIDGNGIELQGTMTYFKSSQIRATSQIWNPETATNTNTPSGATTHQMTVRDSSGTLLGYVPIYNPAW